MSAPTTHQLDSALSECMDAIEGALEDFKERGYVTIDTIEVFEDVHARWARLQQLVKGASV